jgi:hypothetical protein
VQPRTVRPFTILAPAALLALAPGCLPEGEPGLGEPLVSRRGLGGLLFAKAAGTGEKGLLYSHRGLSLSRPVGPEREYQGSPPEDLFFLGAAGAEPHRLLEKYAGPAQWDARGRLYIGRDLAFRYDPTNPRNPATYELWRFDLGDLSALALGRVTGFEVSPTGTRVAYSRADGQGLLRTTDEQQFPLGAVDEPHFQFVGEDLYFLQAGALVRLRDPGTPAAPVMAGKIESFDVLGAGPRHLLVRTWDPTAAAAGRIALVETAGDPSARILGTDWLLGRPVFSPDGYRLAWMERIGDDRGALRLLDLGAATETGTELMLPPRPPSRDPPGGHAPDPAPGVDARPPELEVTLEFRPGSEELWCFFPRELRIFAPDGTARSFPLPEQGPPGLGAPRFVNVERFASDYYGDGASFSPILPVQVNAPASRFNADGRLWTLVRGGEGHLGPADRPEAEATVRLFGEDDFDRNVFELAGGGRVAFWASEGAGRRALFLADLETRLAGPALRVLARNVRTLQLGRRRALVLARPLSGSNGGPGDLSVVDLANGAETRLAQNVTSFALDPACAACDPVDAGARLVYVVHARVPWKYDGLWSGSLP